MSPRRSVTASSAAFASSPRRTCRRARSRSGSPGRASTTRMAWRRRADGKVARISPLIPGDRPCRRGHRERRARDPARIRGPGPRLRPGRLAARRLHRVRAGAGRLGRSAGAGPLAARGDGDRDGRLHRGDVRRRRSRTAGCSPTRARSSSPARRAAWAARPWRSSPSAATRSGPRPARPTRQRGC